MAATIPLKQTCSLARFKYSLSSPAEARQRALRRAVKAYGSRYVIQKLNVLRTYRKGMDTPWKRRQYRQLDSDLRYVQRYRDAMSDTARADDLKQSRAYARLNASKKTFCA